MIEIKLDLIDKLSRVLGTDEIDVVILNLASLPLCARVISHRGQRLVDKAPFERHKFESLILRKYFGSNPPQVG